MAWVDKRRSSERFSRWRLREKMDGKSVTIIRDLGTQKGVADKWKVDFEVAVNQGFTYTAPITVTDIKEFLDAIKEGRDAPNSKRVKVAELCDLWVQHYGPSLKGGISEDSRSPYCSLKTRLGQLKAEPILGAAGKPSTSTWGEMWADEITDYHVRDLLAKYKSPGTKLRWIGACGAIFNGAAEWNRKGNVLPYAVRLPKYNPFKEWRAQMKPSEKEELPDTRWLRPDEWHHFKKFLPAKALAICERALRRFMSLADIRGFADKGLAETRERREKSGEVYTVPSMAGTPGKYDFTNFLGAFKKAQRLAEMAWPADDPRHFSPKDLRRTGAMWAWHATKDLVAIQKMLGHKKITTTQRYLGIIEADIHTVAAAVDAIANGDIVELPRQQHKQNGGAPVELLQNGDRSPGKFAPKLYAMESE